VTRRRRQRIDVNLEEIKQIIDRTAASDDDRAKLFGVVETLARVTEELGSKRASLGRLRKLLFGVKTEKLTNLLGVAASDQPTAAPQSARDPTQPQGDGAAQAPGNQGTSSPAESSVPPGNEAPKKKRKGHGRHSARDYTGANQIHVPHESLKPGDPCPLPGHSC
jgi:transposase